MLLPQHERLLHPLGDERLQSPWQSSPGKGGLRLGAFTEAIALFCSHYFRLWPPAFP